ALFVSSVSATAWVSSSTKTRNLPDRFIPLGILPVSLAGFPDSNDFLNFATSSRCNSTSAASNVASAGRNIISVDAGVQLRLNCCQVRVPVSLQWTVFVAQLVVILKPAAA